MTTAGVDHCPACGHDHFKTVGTKVKGRGSMRTLAIQECAGCGTLWGEPREFYGVMD